MTPIVKATCGDFQNATRDGDRPVFAMFFNPGVLRGYITSLARYC